MFDHLSITTTGLDRAQRFYDPVLGALGGIRDVYAPDDYAAFVRDPDGNRLEALTRRPEEQE